MSFDWSKSAEGGNAEKMSNGYHYATVDRVILGSKGKGLFKSKSGDPQIMVVFTDPIDGGESSSMFTLSDKAAWTLSRLLARLGVDLDALKAQDVSPKHFANGALAESYLRGKSCWIKVEPDPAKPEYQRITPLEPTEVPDEVRNALSLTDDADPFK